MTFDQTPGADDTQDNFPALRATMTTQKIPAGLAPNKYRRKGFTAPPTAGRALDNRLFASTPFHSLPFYFPTLSNPVAGYDGGFNAAALNGNPFGVIALLLPYLDIQEHDFIRVEVNGIVATHHTVTQDEATNGETLVFFIPSTRFIEQASNTVQAFLVRIGGNEDQTQLFNLFVDGIPPVGIDPVYSTPYNENMAPLKFTDPQIEAFGVIRDQAITLGVGVEIATYPLDTAQSQAHHRKEGDVIVVSVGGVLYSHTVTAFEASNHDPIRFKLYFSFWNMLTDGVWIIEWFVRDLVGNQSPGFSPPRLIQLDRGTSGEPLLPEIYVVEAIYDDERELDVIDTHFLTDDATMELAIRNQGYVVGDQVPITVRGLTPDGTASILTVTHKVTSITPLRVYIPLDLDFLLALAGGRILITYKRIRANTADRNSRAMLYAVDGEPIEDGLAPPIFLDLVEGVLPAHTNPVRVLVKRYLGQNPGDRVDLEFTGRTAEGAIRYATYTDAAGNGDLEFQLENEFFEELDGGFVIGQYIINSATQRPPSRTVTVPVGDAQAALPAPYALQTPPPDVTFDPGISLANLNARIPAHPLIVAGTQLRLYAIGSHPNGSFTSPPFNVDENWEGADVPITVPRVHVLANLNGTMRLYYALIPEAPNASPLFSQDLLISVGMKLKLPTPPHVLEATAISPTEAELNPLHVLPPSPTIVTVRVTYDGMLASDDVKLHIIGMPGLGEPNIPAKPGVPDAGANYITFTTSSQFVSAYLDAFCQAYFTVTRGGNTVESQRLTLRVKALPDEALDVVSIPEANATNVISVNASNHVQVSQWPFFRTGQAVYIYLTHTSGDLTLRNGIVVSSAEFTAGRTLDLIPGTYLSPLPNGSTLTVDAKVSLDGTNLESSAVSLNARTYTISSVPALTIPSGTRYVNLGGWLLKGVGNTQAAYGLTTRTASGGKPPYRYYSNNPNAVSVNISTGQVNIEGPGTATIRVEDSSQPALTASYQIQVSGSYSVCTYRGTAPWWTANATGQLLSLSQFSSLISRFGSAFPMNGLAWTIHPKAGQPDVYHSVYVPSGQGLDWGTWSGAPANLLVFIVS
ncbi:hypothetical protein JWR97_04350 [Pseudomonas cedrina subsp. fulgida]|nr:hypothetical protein [Pseudomonas cedrina subsp. fulgida]